MGQEKGTGLSYGELLPKIVPDDTDGKPAQLTVRRVRTQNMAPEGRAPEVKLVIEFAETFKAQRGFDADSATRREYVVNATSYKTLRTKLGDDHDKWVGQPIVMAPTTTTFDNKSFEKLHVASLDRWDKVVAATTKARTRK